MKIVLATGGTGGHIFPALETACVLKERGHEVIFIGSLGKIEEKVKLKGFKVEVVDAKGLTNRSFLGLCEFSGVMLQAIGRSIRVLKQNRPDRVIGFGGYGSFAVVLAAWFSNIPTMIHEQNVVPGKANRLLAKLVKKIAISFSETKDYLDSSKMIWTGCPCHQNKPLDTKETLLKKFSLDSNRRTILVLGGSQGSQKINEVFFELVSSQQLPEVTQVIHMTGTKEYAFYATKDQHSAVPVRFFEFLSPIEEAYAIADVVITRAGAATVSELGFFGIPSILIPYPLADGHQKYNAQVLSRLGIAQIIEQKDCTKETLKQAIEISLISKGDKKNYALNAKKFFKEDPAKELAIAIEGL